MHLIHTSIFPTLWSSIKKKTTVFQVQKMFIRWAINNNKLIWWNILRRSA